MGKSIEDILKQIELERSQRINEEQSKLDEINQQRDLARKEWNKRLSMYESISNESTSPAAGAGGGSINEVIEYLTWIYISGDDLEYKVMSFSPSSIEIESQNPFTKKIQMLRGYPSIYYINNNKNITIEYNDDRTLESLILFLKNNKN